MGRRPQETTPWPDPDPPYLTHYRTRHITPGRMYLHRMAMYRNMMEMRPSRPEFRERYFRMFKTAVKSRQLWRQMHPRRPLPLPK